jgi:uncharacterized protein (DUF885 family)
MLTQGADDLSAIERAIVDHDFDLRPTLAVDLGLHTRDGVLPSLDAATTDRWARKADRLLTRLKEIRESDLSPARQLDRLLLELVLEGALFDLRETRELDRNPMAYLFLPTFTTYISRAYAPVDHRVESIAQILEGVPRLLLDARRRLEPILPRPFVALSIQMGEGLLEHFEEADNFASRESAGTAVRLRRARPPAEDSVRSLVESLRTDYLPRSNDDFSLGSDRFQRLLWVREGLKTAFGEVLARGREDLRRNQQRLKEIALRERSTVPRLIAQLSQDHPTPEALLSLVRTLTDEAREFVRSKTLATLPEPEICHIRESPAFARGLWTAALSGPGPFDVPVDGIYWITTVDPSWTPGQQEEWMRTLNFSMLKNTTIHEVYPGHYLESLHFRQAAKTFARKVYFSASYTEGWAHYCEQLAIEAGFDGRSIASEVAELHDAVLRDCRLIVSIGLHTQGMTLADATRFFQREARLEELHAQREAIRGTFNPEYFCYTLGKLAILEVRSKFLDSKFHGSLRSFHDALLSFGSPPIGFLDPLLQSL